MEIRNQREHDPRRRGADAYAWKKSSADQGSLTEN
jgi:hypothetical protein